MKSLNLIFTLILFISLMFITGFAGTSTEKPDHVLECAMDLKLVRWSIFIIMYQCVFLSEAWHDQYDDLSYDDLTQQDDILSSKRLFKHYLRNPYGNNRQYLQHSATSESQRDDAKKPILHQTPKKQTENKSFSDQRNNNASVQGASNDTVSKHYAQNDPKDRPKATVPLLEAGNEGNKAKSDAAMNLLLDLLPGLFPTYLQQLKNNTKLKDVDEVLTTTPSSNEPDDYQQEYNQIKDEQQENNPIKDEKNPNDVNSHGHLLTNPIFQINEKPHPAPSSTADCPRETVYYPVPVYNMRPLPEYFNINPQRIENNLPDTSQTSPNLHPMLHDSYANRLPVCKPGSKWRRNCHECICDPAGSPNCIKIENCQIKPPGKPMQCKPYSKYDLDECNKCECDGDGVPICTFLECPTYGPPVDIPLDNVSKIEKDSDPLSYYNKPSSTRFQVKINQRYHGIHGECGIDSKLKRCAPGTRWQSECYECACNWKGKQFCFRLPNCPLSQSGDPGRCKPNTSFFDKCKRCSCDDEGRPICDNLCYTDNYDNYHSSQSQNVNSYRIANSIKF